MRIPRSIVNAINANDIDAIRVEIQELVRLDCNSRQPRALPIADMVAARSSGIYDNDDGRHSSCDSTNVTEDDWSRTRAALRLNFSREKLVALRDMTFALRGKGVERFQLPRRSKLMIGLVALTTLIVIAMVVSLVW